MLWLLYSLLDNGPQGTPSHEVARLRTRRPLCPDQTAPLMRVMMSFVHGGTPSGASDAPPGVEWIFRALGMRQQNGAPISAMPNFDSFDEREERLTHSLQRTEMHLADLERSATNVPNLKALLCHTLLSGDISEREAMRRAITWYLVRLSNGEKGGKPYFDMESCLRPLLGVDDPEVTAIAATALWDCGFHRPGPPPGEELSSPFCRALIDGLFVADCMVRMRSAEMLAALLNQDAKARERFTGDQGRDNLDILENRILSSVRCYGLSVDEIRGAIRLENAGPDAQAVGQCGDFAEYAERSSLALWRLMQFACGSRPNAALKFILALAPVLEIADTEARFMVSSLIQRLIESPFFCNADPVHRKRVLNGLLQSAVPAFFANASVHGSSRVSTQERLFAILNKVFGVLSEGGEEDGFARRLVTDVDNRLVSSPTEKVALVRVAARGLLWLLHHRVRDGELILQVKRLLEEVARLGFGSAHDATALALATHIPKEERAAAKSRLTSEESGHTALRQVAHYRKQLVQLTEGERERRLADLLEHLSMAARCGAYIRLDWCAIATLCVATMQEQGLSPEILATLGLLGSAQLPRQSASEGYRMPLLLRPTTLSADGQAQAFPKMKDFIADCSTVWSENGCSAGLSSSVTRAGTIVASLMLLSHLREGQQSQVAVALNAMVELAGCGHPDLVASALFAFAETLRSNSPTRYKLVTALQIIRNRAESSQADLMEPVWDWAQGSEHRQMQQIAVQTRERIENGPTQVV